MQNIANSVTDFEKIVLGKGDDGASQDPLGLSEDETAKVDSELEKIKGMTLDELADALKKSHHETVQINHQVVSLSKRAIVDGWKNGFILNRAKELNPEKGKFSKWRKMELVDSGLMSVRTAQRYMELASKCPSLDDLLKSATSLRRAYQNLGILPPDKKADGTGGEQSKGKSSDLEELMKGFSETQKTLRRLVEKVCGDGKLGLPKDQLDQLRLTRLEIDGFFAKLLAKSGGGDGENSGSGKSEEVGNAEMETSDGPPSELLDPDAGAKGSQTHRAFGDEETPTKKAGANKSKANNAQSPAAAS